MRRPSAGLALILLIGSGPSHVVAFRGPATERQQPTDSGTYSCPMHPEVATVAPGVCPRCGMALIRVDPYDARQYDVDVRTDPVAIRAGRELRLRLIVREPISRTVVRDFVTVHDKRYHLFVISADLRHYAHVHPEQDEDGSWSVPVTLPRAGYYTLYSDFLPVGGTPQVVSVPLITSGYAGDRAASRAHLVPDRTLTKPVGDMTVALAVPEEGFVAGREETFACRLTDRETGQDVTDLEPYLAAWGHSLILSEDSLAVVHAHPVEPVPLEEPAARGGPTVTFKAMFPKAGRYRIWTQLKRHGEVVTAVFTIDVVSPTRRRG